MTNEQKRPTLSERAADAWNQDQEAEAKRERERRAKVLAELPAAWREIFGEDLDLAEPARDDCVFVVDGIQFSASATFPQQGRPYVSIDVVDECVVCGNEVERPVSRRSKREGLRELGRILEKPAKPGTFTRYGAHRCPNEPATVTIGSAASALLEAIDEYISERVTLATEQ